MTMGDHINKAGQFQSDKYPSCPAGKVPLSVKDQTAQDLLWAYAARRESVDADFAADLRTCLLAAGYTPPFAPAERATAEELAEVARLDATATPPPWDDIGDAALWTTGDDGEVIGELYADADRAFASRARTLLPKLAAEVTALRAEVADLRAERQTIDLMLTEAGIEPSGPDNQLPARVGRLVFDANDESAKLEALREKARAMLREVEWMGDGQATKHGCPVCGAAAPRYPGGGVHEQRCRFAATIAEIARP